MGFNITTTLESFVMDDLKEYVKDNLNHYIQAINTAYVAAGSFAIPEISTKDRAWVIRGQMVDAPNYDQYVMIDIGTDPEVINNFGDGAIVINAIVLVARTTGNLGDDKEYRTNLRYMEAVRALMARYDHIQLDGKRVLQSVMPTQIRVGKDGNPASMAETIISGVRIQYALA